MHRPLGEAMATTLPSRNRAEQKKPVSEAIPSLVLDQVESALEDTLQGALTVSPTLKEPYT